MAAFTLGAILAGAGLGAKLIGQKRASNAIEDNVNNVLALQRQTQDRLDRERQQKISEALNQTAVGKEQTQNAQQQRSQEIVSKLEGNQAGGGADPAPADGGGDGEGPAGKVLSNNAENLAAAREEDNQQRRQAIGELDSLADVFSENNLTLQPFQTEIGLNRRTAREEARRLPLETQVATQKGARKGRALRTVGDLALNAGTAVAAGGTGGGGGTPTLPGRFHL